MAKAVICDRCKKAVAESKIVAKDYSYEIDADFSISFNFRDGYTRQPYDICGKCGAELLLEFGDRIKRSVEKAKKDKAVFSL